MEAEIEGKGKEVILTLYPETTTEEFACWKLVEAYANVRIDKEDEVAPAICINISRLSSL